MPTWIIIVYYILTKFHLIRFGRFWKSCAIRKVVHGYWNQEMVGRPKRNTTTFSMTSDKCICQGKMKSSRDADTTYAWFENCLHDALMKFVEERTQSYTQISIRESLKLSTNWQIQINVQVIGCYSSRQSTRKTFKIAILMIRPSYTKRIP